MEASHLIADMLDYSRKFNLYYLNLLDPARMAERYTFADQTVNSAGWILGHLAWGEQALIGQCCGGPVLDIPWLDRFAFGSSGDAGDGLPTAEIILKDMEQIHTNCLDYIRSLGDAELEEAVYIPPMKWNTIRRKAFYHVIRHESFHTGQLAWIVKAQGGGGKLP